jgi:UDP-N-acetylmuramoyl-L-alanyl-D-glutamate--2,6-diaminopimelate ligase
MKKILKQVTPDFILGWYHFCLAVLANIWYRFPSRRLIVIGVTGTKGKSTTANMIWQILTTAGYRVGLTTTANVKIDRQEWTNNSKMTMPGRFQLQRLLRRMVRAGCQYAVIETSSEGIKQFRHIGIFYQIAVFTNLTPEHIETHGNFENYRGAKSRLFYRLRGKQISILNHDDSNFSFFKSIPARQYIYYGLNAGADLQAVDCQELTNGWKFTVKGHLFHVPLLGKFNVMNALAAIAVGKAINIKWQDMIQALERFSFMPGRMEEIVSPRGFSIFVDYAHTPESLELVYQTLKPRARRLIAVLGSCGGGRDRAKRPILGRLAGTYADVVIITNEDPYDEDPQKIIDEVWSGLQVSPVEKYQIFDRGEAIHKAIQIALPGDVVVITGKGSEQAIVTSSGMVPWDDREKVRNFITQRRDG